MAVAKLCREESPEEDACTPARAVDSLDKLLVTFVRLPAPFSLVRALASASIFAALLPALVLICISRESMVVAIPSPPFTFD
jgi:hypothetical protein